MKYLTKTFFLLSCFLIGFVSIAQDQSQNKKTGEDVILAYETGHRDFSGWDLREANLKWANLQGINLKSADLREANLKWANLTDADLKRADLREANLKWAYLVGANLSFADLRGTDLTGAFLAGAKYNKQTLFPDNFDPVSRGMVLVSE